MKGLLLLLGILFNSALSYGQATQTNDSTSYFPTPLYKRDIPEVEILDSTKRSFHSKMLKAFKEEKLFNLGSNKTVYRFTRLRSFHLPMVIKLEKNGDETILITKIGNKVGLDNSHYDLSTLTAEEKARLHDYSIDTLDSAQVKDILQKMVFVKDTIPFSFQESITKVSDQDFNEFVRLINENSFWQLPAMEAHLVGTDGADWILEAISENKGYHMVYRWSPSRKRDKNFRDMGVFLLKLAHIKGLSVY